MRSWYPIDPSELPDKQLLAEHNELLIMARAIKGLLKGWAHHPETKRWMGHSKAMKTRHDQLVQEMLKRGFNHRSPWPQELINDDDPEAFPTTLWEPLETMKQKLEQKRKG